MKLVRCGGGSVCSVLADCLMCQAENTLQTLGDFVVHELESTLRAEVFHITASHRQTKSSGTFLSKSISATPAQVIEHKYPDLINALRNCRLALDTCEGPR